MTVRPLPPILLEQGREEAGQNPGDVEYDQYAVGIVDVFYQMIRVDQPMDGDPDAQQHHGEFQGRLQGIVYDVVHPVACAADKGFYNLPAQQGQQFHDDKRSCYDE